MKNKFFILQIVVLIFVTCLLANCKDNSATEVGKLTNALDASAWETSIWISATDAPVLKDNNNGRAPDGASWFVSKVKNEQKVVSAKWMTTGLGIYEIYLNGRLV